MAEPHLHLQHRARPGLARRQHAAHPLQQPGEAQRAVGRHVGSGAAAAGARARRRPGAPGRVLRRGREGLRLGRRHLAVRGHARRARGRQPTTRRWPKQTLTGIHDFPKPTLACIRGWCIGGGVNVAISCDIRIASTDSVFAIPAARLGLGYRYSAMKNLVDLIGPGAAKDLFFTARRIDAAEAKALGLVSRTCAPEALDALLAEYTRRLAENAPLTVMAGKAITREILKASPGPRPGTLCASLIRGCFESADYTEGRTAFMEKRKPVFTGRYAARWQGTQTNDAVLLDADDGDGHRAASCATRRCPNAGPRPVAGAHARRRAEPRRVPARPRPARQGRHLEGHRRRRRRRGGGASAPSVTGFKPGDRVMGRCAGAFSEYALMEARRGHGRCRPACRGKQAASIPLTFLVAYDMLVLQGRLKAGEWLLVNGVSSGVGVASLQLAQGAGRARHRHLGLGRQAGSARAPSASTSACARAQPDFAPAVMEATGRHGVDLIVNTVGGTVFAENVRALAFEGRLATVGYVDGVRARRHRPRGAACQAADGVRRVQQAAHARSSAPRPCRVSSREVLPHIAERPHPAADRPGDGIRASSRTRRRAWKPARTSARSCCACRRT